MTFIGHRVLKALREQAAGARAINVLAIPATVSDTETVTINGVVYEIDTNGQITAGHIKVDVSGGGTKANGTLTSNNTNVSAADTVTLGATTYTFKSALTGAANEVLIGASADASLTNLASAINGTAGAGTTYGTGTVANASANSSATPTAHVLTFTALITGTGGNSIALAKSAATLTVSAANLASGAQPTGAQAVTALVTAINTTPVTVVNAVAGAANEVLIYTIKTGPFSYACSKTLAGSGNQWSSGNMFGGASSGFPDRWTSHRNPTAQEVTDGNMYFAFPFAPTFARISIRTSAGVMKSWDGVLTITGNYVKMDNSGSTNWAATDLVICEASE